ncbi:MAG: TIGR03905 family TSCPD domain-containing protein [Clostridia bacterium]|nr:TIGR03905 family TSCPD domain-containing protein [Clostridia bacterium]
MNRFTYKPKGVCANEISFDVDEGLVKNVSFSHACAGNTEGISRLVEGLPVDYVIAKLKGTRCGRRETSCPDQLAKALEESKKI